jgi:hypothetical protein
MEKKELENLNEMGERLMKIVESDPKNEKAWEGFNKYVDLLLKVTEGQIIQENNTKEMMMKRYENPIGRY